MTPIQRISEKSQALAVLGLNTHANTLEIRKAYKALALEKHPDQEAGSNAEFAEITKAYQFLRANFELLGIPKAPAVSRRKATSRPLMEPKEIQFSGDIIAECKACLPGNTDSYEHVSTILHRLGRKLTYFVPTSPANGTNEVAVPTGELVDTRHAHPRIVPVNAKDVSAGTYEVPTDVCADLFPGARSVTIRFAA